MNLSFEEDGAPALESTRKAYRLWTEEENS